MKKLTFLISSSEKYHDVLSCCIELINKYFKNFIIQIYVVTNGQFKAMKNVRVIEVKKKNYFWSDRILEAINRIEDEKFFLLTEDLFFKKTIDIFQIDEIINFFNKSNANCLYLSPTTSIGKKTSHPLFFEIPFWAIHRVSLQLAIWKKSYLKKVLVNNETPWEFETNGTKRSKFYSNIFISKKNILNYTEVVGKGKITPEGIDIIRRNNLQEPNIQKFTFFEMMLRKTKHLKSKIYHNLPLLIQKKLFDLNFIGKTFK